MRNISLSLWEGKIQIQEDRKMIRPYFDLVEHIEVLCNSGESEDTKYLDEKPKNAGKWTTIIKVLRILRKNR